MSGPSPEAPGELLTELRAATAAYQRHGLTLVAWLTARPGRLPKLELSGAYSPGWIGSCREVWSPRPTRAAPNFRRRLRRRGEQALTIRQARSTERSLTRLYRRGAFDDLAPEGAGWEWDYEKSLDLNRLALTVHPATAAGHEAARREAEELARRYPGSLYSIF